MSDNLILPRFKAIDYRLIKKQLMQLLIQSKDQIIQLVENNKDPSWSNLLEPLESIFERLQNMWSPIEHLKSVSDSALLRDICADGLTQLSDFDAWFSQYTLLYELLIRIRKASFFTSLTEDQKKIIQNKIKDFELSGINLPLDQQKRYAEIQKKLSALSLQFSNNVLDAIGAWSKPLDLTSNRLGLSEYLLSLMKHNAASQSKTGYLLTLDAPCFFSFMRYCTDRVLRQEAYTAYCTLASDQNQAYKPYDNTDVIRQIVALRQEESKLLGFENYASYSLENKMAKTPDEIIHFLMDLLSRSQSKAVEELAELQAFANEELSNESLAVWDIAYFSEKMQQKLYQFDQEILRDWFPVPHVLSELFKITSQLFDIDIQLISSDDVWHDTVQLYQVSRNKAVLGYFYVDLYARDNKQSGAWMGELRNRWIDQKKIQLPVAFFVCNFTRPLDGQASLLLHSEVVTLFHEFGHTLHHVLTQIDYPSISGLHGVSRDAIELPSQLLENWCWDKTLLKQLSSHYKNKTPLTDQQIDQLILTKTFQPGMSLVRQLAFSLFDMRIHSEDPDGRHVQSILDQVREQVAVILPPKFERFQNSFLHIFEHDYAAGYYGYLWAEVLSADVFSVFQEEGLLNPVTGKRFLDAFLSQGGSKDAMDMFVEFRGRKPNHEAFLKQNGLN